MTRFCGSKAKILFEGNNGNVEYVKSGAESHVPSGNTGQGVYLCGKLKEFNSVGVAKANVRSASEGHGSNQPESHG